MFQETVKSRTLLKALSSRIYASLNLKLSLGLGLLLIAGTGCGQLEFFNQFTDASFKMQVAEAVNDTYEIAGETDLPEDSKVAVAAVRYLYPSDRSAQSLTSKATYSILDYQLVQVKQGKWQASLKLLKPYGEQTPQEAWQLEQLRLGMPLKPEKDVIFLATLASADLVDQLQNLEQQLAKRKFKLDEKLIYTTASGQQYVQISHIQEIAPPESSKIAWKPPENEINGGWGKRYLMPPEAIPPYKFELPEKRKTDAPAKSDEFLK